MKLVSILVVISLITSSVLGSDLHISSADDFIDFANNVNSGTSYSVYTVYLDTDIDLSGKSLDVIGNTNSKYFQGTFDGQGHIISNLKINSNSHYAGLFGYSKGLTIKNVVVVESCSVESSYSSGNVYLGGIIGYCYVGNDNCNIESIVNMGNVTFSGNVGNSEMCFGGIAGYLSSSSSYRSTVKNCANYGAVTHSGKSGDSYIGGIVGESYGDYYDSGYSSAYYYVYIQNCLNYGAITLNGEVSSDLDIGGINGYSFFAMVENCVSGGLITGNSKSDTKIGSIVGYVVSETSIKYCFWTSDVGYSNAYGDGNPTVDYESSQVTLNYRILNKLNSYSTKNGFGSWAMLYMNGAKLNDVSQEYLVVNNKYFPDANKEGYTFDGWFKDSEFNKKYDPKTINTLTDAYAKFTPNNYIISFNTTGGTPVDPITSPYKSVVTLPTTSTKGSCKIAFWVNENGDRVSDLTVPARNVTLTAVWLYTHIASVDDFIDFANNVNSGNSYSGTTVYLDSDIDLSGKSLDVVGKGTSNYFLGTFDGQGHIISNLKIKSNSQYAGLFGYSSGLTIKNVVFDGTCSVESSYSSDDVYIGGIIGECYAENGDCNIVNTVNMGNLAYSENTDDRLYLGGIAGSLESPSSYTSTVKNCANYGTITRSGTSGDYSFIGGIFGYSSGYSSYSVHIQNCLNYGDITHSGTASSDLDIGGISGDAYETSIENCVSAGIITNSESNADVGSIVGYTSSSATIKYCFWTSDVGYNDTYGYGDPTIDDVTSQITDNSETLNTLNTYSGTYTWNGWILNKNKVSVSFTVNNTKGFTLSSQIILLPSLANEGKLLYQWYRDRTCTTPFTETEVVSATELYGRYEENNNNYVITFNTTGGTPVDAVTSPYNSVVTLPTTSTRDYCTFMYWVNENGDKVSSNSFTVPARDVTLTALWMCTRLAYASDFIDFARVVNNGISNYSGTTVYLDTDIDFSGKSLDVVGKDWPNYFQGTFDGQGHIISNLKIKSNSRYVGLFGYSRGLTIKNVVIDGTCSVESSYSSGTAHLGGIIGYCKSTSSNCNIENIVNMGNVTFSGSANYLYFGGIAGYLETYSYKSFVKNCANYGTVTHSGNGGGNSYIGGIIGESDGSSSNYVYIQNCLNYGAITHSGIKSGDFRLGGIVGYAEYTKIENCVSAGGLITVNSSPESYVGSIVGITGSNSYINSSFWTSDVGYNNVSGSGEPTIDDVTSQVVINSTILENLNTYSSTNGWNNWAGLHLNGGRINSIDQDYLIANNKYFPDPEKEGLVFAGWFKDSKFNKEYNPKIDDTLVDVYAKYEKNHGGSFTIGINPISLVAFILLSI